MKYCILIFLFLSSCALYPKRTVPFAPSAPPKEKALVYLYRTPTDIHSANPDVPRFFINGEKIGKLSIGGYYVHAVEPGETTIIYKDSLFLIPFPWTAGTVKFNAKPGEKYFAKFSVETVFAIIRFELVPNSLGEREIQSTLLLEN